MMTTNSPKLYILDVGHGNSAILTDTHGNVVIDCAPGGTLLANLQKLGISEITAVMISHADTDHLAGIMGLLCNEKIKIGTIYINPDSTKKTKIWRDFRASLLVARQKGNIRVETSLNTNHSGQVSAGEVYIEVLSPNPEMSLSGAGGIDVNNRVLTSNSMSVVIGLIHKGHRVAILAGDLDDIGLDNLLLESSSLEADILVFPHHGGAPGNYSATRFANLLCSHIKPKLIIFSIDSNRFDNPKDEIIMEVKESLPNTHIMCTQLANKCLSWHQTYNASHLTNFSAQGFSRKRCCGGTIEISLDGQNSSYLPKDLHQLFVKMLLKIGGNPRCLY